MSLCYQECDRRKQHVYLVYKIMAPITIIRVNAQKKSFLLEGVVFVLRKRFEERLRKSQYCWINGF
ncbi:MAG: hypothetical protein MAG581_01741 [Deltaproteobacteria bacterium]|jgi:hypothetical protein|nr:hypothetical protein [Deltaproteobacteria bacterium]